MAIEALVSKFRKTNLKIYIIACLAFAAWCAYDGYFNDKWIKKHTDDEGNPEFYLVFNRNVPYYLTGGAALLGVYLLMIRNRKVTADEDELVINNKERIRYDSIEKINKTHFDSKGFFIITYKNEAGKEVDRKLSDRKYDNMAAVLDHLVVKIS